MSTIALNHYQLPDLEPYSADRRSSAPHRSASPWRTFGASSGAIREISHRISPASGVSYWLEAILGLAEKEATAELTTPDVPGALIEIRDAFSLNTVQLADVLGVSRQSIYDWNEGKTVKPQNRHRIAAILAFVEEWRKLHPGPMGPISSEIVEGVTLIELLRADRLESAAVSDLLVAISTRLGEITAERPLSARELAAKHGMPPLSAESHRRNLQNARLRNRRHW